MPQFIMRMTCYIFPICPSCCPEPFKTLLSVLKNDHVGCIDGCPCPLTANWLAQQQELRGRWKRRLGHLLPASSLSWCQMLAICLSRRLMPSQVAFSRQFFLVSSSHSLSFPCRATNGNNFCILLALECCAIPFGFPNPDHNF